MKRSRVLPVLASTLMGLLASQARGAVARFDPTDSAAVPQWLSQTGVYSNTASRVPDAELVPFEVNAALWSDGAAKQRWIALPPGKAVPYVDTTDAFAYPDSTIFVKNFLLERVQGDSSTRVLLETRLLVNRRREGRDVWYGFTYRWNAEGTDARLVPAAGFDTIFAYYPRGLGKPQGYRKWRYPSRLECNICHLPTNPALSPTPARGILGFFPAQLKRAAPGNGSLNQVHALFDANVFTGTRPNAAALARRWKGLHEALPPGRGSDARFRALDTVARAYLGANCSGCHGDRGIRHSPSVPVTMNFDFYDLRPRQELGHLEVSDTRSLDDPEITSTAGGRGYYLQAVARAGLDTSAGADWDLRRLPASRAKPPAFVYPGYPAVSLMLYRQLVRRAPWRDSVVAYETYGTDTQGWGGWLFSVPWGTEAWRDLVRAHDVPLNFLIEHTRDGGSSGGQMPPVPASFIADTAALRVLGEWVRDYRTLYVVDTTRIIAGLRAARADASGPAVRGRLVIWEPDGAQVPRLTTLGGRQLALVRTARGRWLIPASVPPGVYLLRAGKSVQRILL